MLKKSFIQFCLLSLLFAGSLFSQESLFLRATGECKIVKNDETKRLFQVGDGKTKNYEQGKAISIANPTYDLTFKSLFLGMNNVDECNLASPKNAKKRLISLLNSLIYSKASDKNNKKRIVSVEITGGTILVSKSEKLGAPEGKKRKRDRTGSAKENAMTELRCDIVCKCIIARPRNQEKELEDYVLYFDIEMQRRNAENPVRRFLAYQEGLKQSGKNTRVIAFLDYFTEDVVEETKIGRLVKDPQTRKMVAAPEEKDTDLNPMIGLKAVVGNILRGEEVKIMNHAIEQTGKEWLKFLGTRWWASKHKKDEEWYVIPSEVQTQEVADALEVLEMSKVDQDAFKKEVEDVFNAQKILDEWEKNNKARDLAEGEQIGQLKGKLENFMQMFLTSGQFFDILVKGIEPQSLNEDFVRNIWDNLDNTNKTEEKYETFLQALREKELL